MKVNGSKILAKDINFWLKTKSKEILKEILANKILLMNISQVLKKNLSTKNCIGVQIDQ